jgi:hypothetical protein
MPRLHSRPVARHDRSAALAIRLWIEDAVEGEEGLRARITHTLDTELPRSVESAARSEAEIVEAVRIWIRTFLAGRPR